MEIKIQKWGNSCGIRIPSQILNELNLKENDTLRIKKENDTLRIKKENDKIVLKKINKKNIYELFENYNGYYVCEEFEPNDIRGNELW